MRVSGESRVIGMRVRVPPRSVNAKECAVEKSRSKLQNVLAGMTVRERLLFLIRYAKAHAAKRKYKKKSAGGPVKEVSK